MFNDLEVIEYINKLNNNDLFTKLQESEQKKAIFSSTELLRDYFEADKITIRAVSLQVLYSLEGEEEEYAKLKRHGVKSYNVKGVSVTFDGSGLSPDVINLLSEGSVGKVSSLI